VVKEFSERTGKETAESPLNYTETPSCWSHSLASSSNKQKAAGWSNGCSYIPNQGWVLPISLRYLQRFTYG
jgi:hypothetical protein